VDHAGYRVEGRAAFGVAGGGAAKARDGRCVSSSISTRTLMGILQHGGNKLRRGWRRTCEWSSSRQRRMLSVTDRVICHALTAEQRLARFALKKWVSRVVELRSRVISVDQRWHASLVRGAFVRWQSTLRQRFEDVSLAQSFKDVKQEGASAAGSSCPSLEFVDRAQTQAVQQVASGCSLECASTRAGRG
jgi:hypothetical protein